MTDLQRAVAWLEETEKVKQSTVSWSRAELVNEYRRAVANCRTLLDALRWIPVSERLPDEGVPVLVTYIGHNTKKAHSDGIAKWSIEANSYNGGWLWNDADTSVAVTITHWMPLPAPPEGSE